MLVGCGDEGLLLLGAEQYLLCGGCIVGDEYSESMFVVWVDGLYGLDYLIDKMNTFSLSSSTTILEHFRSKY